MCILREEPDFPVTRTILYLQFDSVRARAPMLGSYIISNFIAPADTVHITSKPSDTSTFRDSPSELAYLSRFLMPYLFGSNFNIL